MVAAIYVLFYIYLSDKYGSINRVLELHDQGKGTREIAQILNMSFRDIGPILKEKEVEKEQAEHQFQSSQAYKLFFRDKTSVQVAIELNLREPEVTRLHWEYCNLVQIYNLNQIYKEIKHDIWYFVELYRLAKVGGFRVEHVVRLLRIANNDLPLVDCKYENLKRDVRTLEEYKRNSEGRLMDLNNQITEASNYVEYYKASCRQEETKMSILRQKRMKLEALVKQFENKNEEYIKIRKTAEEKVLTTLSNRKGLLKLAFLCLTQSMRDDPEKYYCLIHYGGSSTRGYSHPYYGASHLYGQQQYKSKNYGSEDYMVMLVEEADKLWNTLPKELVDKIIADYSTPSKTSLPSLPPPDED